MARERFQLLARRPRHDQGQAAFEFLLVLPVFIMFFLLVIDFGIVMYEHVTVANAVREGARYGAVNCGVLECDAALIQDRVEERSDGILDAEDTYQIEWTGLNRGDSIVVKAEHTYDFLFFSFASWNVSACSVMRLEQQESSTTIVANGSATC